MVKQFQYMHQVYVACMVQSCFQASLLIIHQKESTQFGVDALVPSFIKVMFRRHLARKFVKDSLS